MVDVLRLRPLEGHRLWLRFTDGSEGVRDLSDVVAEGGIMVEPNSTAKRRNSGFAPYVSKNSGKRSGV